jgi:hypothetical protein
MNLQLISANFCSTIARIISIFGLLLEIPYLLFVDLQLIKGESGGPGIISKYGHHDKVWRERYN